MILVKVIILCGGKGLRMRGLAEDVPKVLAKVNGQPIIWHIMKHFSRYNHNHFILPVGYKGDQITLHRYYCRSRYGYVDR